MLGHSSSRQPVVVNAAPTPPRENAKEKEYGDDERIVNYRDAVLYGRDLKLLEGTTTGSSSTMSLWLNDGLVHFQLLRLMHLWLDRSEPFQDPTTAPSVVSSTPRQSAPPFLCMDPSVLSFLMMLNPGSGTDDPNDDDDQEDDDDVEAELQSIAASHNQFEGVRVFFLPVNDGLAPCTTTGWPAPATAAQGTHWSLLVAVAVVDDVDDVAADDDDEAGPPDPYVGQPATKCRHLAYVHFDSVPGHNATAASALAATWDRLWRATNKESTATASSNGVERSRIGSSGVSVREGRAPRQANGYDCGVHVLGSVEALLQTTMTMWTNDSHHHFTHDTLPNWITKWEEALQRHFGSDPACACALLRQRMARDIRALGCPPR
jgi:Ulp1 protease family, C-terminal catalytic domain